MPSSPPRRRPWSGRESPQTSPSSCPGTCLWRIWICAPCWATLWTTPSRAAGAPGNGESPSAAADKGLFMLRVENTLGGAVQPDLATTKTDKAAHGFGIPGMREIAERYGGTLDAGVRDNGFELVVCLPLAGQAETL
ncbi:GHKL domain-containing protein [Dysosmobacter welbionis]|uniref:GHKL domain-containing protein n=1 Tax=Dysosmobacter welbionis TaxID=2093857 RepID=UPI003AB85BFA